STQAPPPWHRGLVAVANLVFGVLVGIVWGAPWAGLVAPAFAFFLTIADVEGPLPRRLGALAWSAGLVGVGSATSLLLHGQPIAFPLVFATLSYGVGLAAWAGTPLMTATRFALVAGLLIEGLAEATVVSVLALLATVS